MEVVISRNYLFWSITNLWEIKCPVKNMEGPHIILALPVALGHNVKYNAGSLQSEVSYFFSKSFKGTFLLTSKDIMNAIVLQGQTMRKGEELHKDVLGFMCH